MGRGKAPCCDKSQVKRGPWSPSEDLRLISFVQKFGHDNWRSLPKQAGLMRCGKSCRLRWINYLRPDVKRGNLTKEEEDTIITLHRSIGNKWSRIAAHLPGRTDNEIKNVWNTYLKKRLSSPPNGEASPSPSSSSCSIPFVDTAAKANASSVVGPAMVDQLVPPPSRTRDDSLKQEQDNLYPEHDFSRRFNRPAEEPDPGDTLFGLLGPSKEDAWEGVYKMEQAVDNDRIEMEVPLEFDHDFWEPFNNLEPIPHHVEGGADPRSTNLETGGVNIWREEIQYQWEKDDQDRYWLWRLERELGMEVAVDDEVPPREF